MGTLMNKRLPAASIIETIVALVITLVLFGITTTILVQTSLSSPSVLKVRANQLINQVAVETREGSRFFDEEITVQNLKVRKKVEAYKQQKNLVSITFTVIDQRDSALVTEQRIMKTN